MGEVEDLIIFQGKFGTRALRTSEDMRVKEGGPTYAHKGGTNHRNRYCNWYLVVFIGVIFIEHTLNPLFRRF